MVAASSVAMAAVRVRSAAQTKGQGTAKAQAVRSLEGEFGHVYAVFLRGSFRVHSRVPHRFGGTASYDAARIVFDRTGEIYNVRLWKRETAHGAWLSGSPAFHPLFDGSPHGG